MTGSKRHCPECTNRALFETEIYPYSCKRIVHTSLSGLMVVITVGFAILWAIFGENTGWAL